MNCVSEQHKVVKDLLSKPDEAYTWTELEGGYKIHVMEKKYRDVKQRWCIVFSHSAYNREIKTFAQRVQAIEDKAVKELWHLSNEVFTCEKDAGRSLKKFANKLIYHQVNGQIEPVCKHGTIGRPPKEAKPDRIGYKIAVTISRDEAKISAATLTKGRFLLATNELDKTKLPDHEILPEYKGQSKTESGFKFIKDDAFEVSSLFLQKPERIAALMMVMTLCLMVYAIAQFELRSALVAVGDTIPSQTKKPTNQPSMKWVYRLFQGVQVITLCLANVTQEIVINLKEVQKKIIRYFGQRAMDIYGIP